MAEHAVWYREAMPDRVLDASASAHPGSVRPIGALVVTNFSVILSLSFCHLLNDTMQSLVPALYPILKASYGLSFARWGSSRSPSSSLPRCSGRWSACTPIDGRSA